VSAHTPGPWSVFKAATENGEFSINATGPYIAETIGGIAEEEANANLIAAAPDLLEALQSVVNAWEEPDLGWEAAEKVHAAIAKATLTATRG
jgi:hypothetical protein